MGDTTSTRPFMTTREAADWLHYSRPDSFLRAWRRIDGPLQRSPGGRWLVPRAELERYTGTVTEPTPAD
jgi:hypothetical protein